jgi:ABC-type nickel/cobalt efflux system permease component RcnA
MDIEILIGTAFSIGFIHTLIGPDHYLPFIMIGRAKQWSLFKTLSLTVISGLGHVIGSVLLGLLGVLLGTSLGLLEDIEAVRGDIASWLLIGFGIAYAFWGLRIGLRSVKHKHEHAHEASIDHEHSHHHLGSHAHIHGDPKTITPWALFIIFVLGPCEPLIPVLMYPAAMGSWTDLGLVTLVFGLTTIITMTGMVALLSAGLLRIKLGFLEKYAHALAGIIIAASGLAIKVFGI